MDTVYRSLQRKLNTLGMGYPETDEGYELAVLEALITPEEAEFANKMPIGLHTAQQVAEDMGISVAAATNTLESLAESFLVFRYHDGDEIKYYLLPSMHGFIDFNVKKFTAPVVKNFSKYFSKGMGARIFGTEVPTFRVLPVRTDIVEGGGCLPCDDAEAIIAQQDPNKIVLLPCMCRHSAAWHPKSTGCKHNPDSMDVCLAFGDFADFYIENGLGRYITKEEALAHIRKCNDLGNVVEVLNTKNVEVMCSCCSCCCTVLKAASIFGGSSMNYSSNHHAVHDETACTKCGICIGRCSLHALKQNEAGQIEVDAQRCLGCGLCVTTCATSAMKLYRKPEGRLYLPPEENFMGLYDQQRATRRATGEI